MANHKRKRPKHQRAGCLLCKYWKDERYPKRKRPEGGAARREVSSREQLKAFSRDQ